MEVGVLIGWNCLKVMKLREVVLGNKEDLYAIWILLGWGIIGPISASNVSSVRAITLPPTTEPSPTNWRLKVGNRFVVDPQRKEVINPFTVKKMLELDFLESDQGQAFSRKDHKFPHIVQKGICLQSDGHYKVPHLWRIKTLSFQTATRWPGTDWGL